MNLNNYSTHPWKIIEEEWNPENVEASESIFSLGNGAMGQRANFEEDYSGESFQGSYVGGVYYPDKTRVGWWKNGYPEYFAKVLNAPNWIGIHVEINGELFDLNQATSIQNYRRELNMKTGVYVRSFTAVFNGITLAIESKRFLSMANDQLGAIAYSLTSNQEVELTLIPYLDAGISNQDSNWDDQFWAVDEKKIEDQRAYIQTHTLKTNFHVGSFMEAHLWVDKQAVAAEKVPLNEDKKIGVCFKTTLPAQTSCELVKFGGYVNSRNLAEEKLYPTAMETLESAVKKGFSTLEKEQEKAWDKVWESADIHIEGDEKAQQAIRFNIFQLNQTYTGKDAGLNIGPKGFTGEKYGGSTYWDTEAYCLPFYMATKNETVARNLLKYRYLQLDRAIENAEKLGFSKGAALYPMVTMNGEECHNEWEITFEEIHRNSAIAFAIFNYTRYTGDTSYIKEMGLEVLIGIARFWAQRVSFSEQKKQYVILGVTGPNEYENNINNNWYTNYSAKWCLSYTTEQIELLKKTSSKNWATIEKKTQFDSKELEEWQSIATKMYLPLELSKGIVLQQDGFLDKSLETANSLSPEERPINQHWSWDRILRSPFIKQADVLQGFYFFEDHFATEELEKNYDFYEPFTVHESSLSPCVHAILAAKLKKDEQAYAFYLRTARLDLDDYNAEVHEGLHITSMAGTWMSIVEGFAGMRVRDNVLSFQPRLPKDWKQMTFKINFRGVIYTIGISKNHFECSVGQHEAELYINNQRVKLKNSIEVPL